MAFVTVAFYNLSCSREDLIQNAQLTPMRCRSRRPLSVDDIPMVEEFLHWTSLCDVHATNFGETQSFVFSPRQHSSDNTYSYNGFSGSVVNDLPDASVLTSEVTKVAPNQHSNSIQCQHLMERLFREIYEDIGACWKRLGRLLIERECVLNNIDADYADVSEKAFQMLSKWKQMKGQQHATPEALFQAVLRIQRADVAERLLKLAPSLFPLAYLLERIIPSRCKLYNTTELPENFDVKKVLLCRNEKVFVCSSKETSHMFVVKKLEDEKNTFAVRKCINSKALRQQKRRLRKTEDFIRDLKVKQKMIQDLLGIIEHLQEHLHSQHQAICQRKHTCNNCDQYRTHKDIIQNDLTLLHYELEKMVWGNRRISFSGIPSDRIYHLARRTYAVYERHKRMHKRRRTSRRQDCSSSSGDDSDSDFSDAMEGPLVCMSNIIFSIANRHSTRTHKVSQSAKTNKTSDPNKIKRNKSNSSPFLRSRKNNVLAKENLVTIPSVLLPRDWSGVPPFKLYSNIKAPKSKESSSKETFKAKLLSKELDEQHYELEPGEVFV